MFTEAQGFERIFWCFRLYLHCIYRYYSVVYAYKSNTVSFYRRRCDTQLCLQYNRADNYARQKNI